MKYLVYLSISIFMFSACNQTKEKIVKLSEDETVEASVSVVNPMNFDLGATTFKVDATYGDTVYLPNGGSVLFDTECFVDSKGKLVKGEVDVQWQEFHTLAEIAASGIPMKYDSAGVANDLESGGMFTISASQKGKPLQMAKGKGAEVNLVSLQDTPCYNFYALDDKTGAWNYETTKTSEVVEVAEVEPVENEKTILEANLNMAKFPELNKDDIIGWKVIDQLSPTTKNWLSNDATQVRLVEKIADNVYSIEAKDKQGSRTMKATPYTMELAQADSKVNSASIQATIDEVAAYQRKMAEGKVIRNIRIAGFGTYNWDIIHKRNNPRLIVANFSYPKGVNATLVSVSLISPEENAIVTYHSERDENFSFDPKKKNCLVGILPNNELVVVKDAGFNNARQLKDGSTCNFQFVKTGIKLKSPDDLSKYIDKLI